jgi:hypothetical protein
MVDWNKAFEFTWRILVFIVAIAIIVIVSTNWTRWEGGEGWQRTNDAEQSLVTLDAAVASSDASLIQLQIDVFKALGGGWHNESLRSP